MSDYYINDEGVWTRIHTDNRGKNHIDFYDKDPKESDHSSIHINWDSNTGNGRIVDTTGESKDSTDTSCYLTSACMKHLQENFDDNCYELTILRWFRDGFISEFEKEHYYKTAPIIVQAIDNNKNKDILYKKLYENIVDKCVKLIEQGSYESAYSIYKNNTLILEEQYAKPLLERKLIKVLKNK